MSIVPGGGAFPFRELQRCPDDKAELVTRTHPNDKCEYGYERCTHICPQCGWHWVLTGDDE